ncbi:hypothetical protein CAUPRSCDRAFT_12139 [Caulochytrium protostelioides]|uniref:Secreted protein n=1 Tax=Caulochytrium protostelioides TaxID=1555241 RepID=A0A4P9WUL3_9FUNG|nr:hypothetical protein CAUPRSCDRAFT_12139 [Caulochytrium protostelioides]
MGGTTAVLAVVVAVAVAATGAAIVDPEAVRTTPWLEWWRRHPRRHRGFDGPNGSEAHAHVRGQAHGPANEPAGLRIAGAVCWILPRRVERRHESSHDRVIHPVRAVPVTARRGGLVAAAVGPSAGLPRQPTERSGTMMASAPPREWADAGGNRRCRLFGGARVDAKLE